MTHGQTSAFLAWVLTLLVTGNLLAAGRDHAQHRRRRSQSPQRLIRTYWDIRTKLDWAVPEDPDGTDVPISRPYESRKRFTKQYQVGRKIVMHMDARNGEVYEIVNWMLVERIRNMAKPEPVHATMEKEAVIELAADFLRMFFAPIPGDAASPEASYARSGESQGTWQVVWRRRKGDFVYQNDRIVVMISEPWGPYAYSRSWKSKPCDLGVPLSEKEAFAIAEKHTMMHLQESLFNLARILSVFQSEALIINRPKMVDGRLQATPEVFPVWAFGLRARDATGRNIAVKVTVDAQTGKVLSTDTQELKG